jgi:hypothetical protein
MYGMTKTARLKFEDEEFARGRRLGNCNNDKCRRVEGLASCKGQEQCEKIPELGRRQIYGRKPAVSRLLNIR